MSGATVSKGVKVTKAAKVFFVALLFSAAAARAYAQAAPLNDPDPEGRVRALRAIDRGELSATVPEVAALIADAEDRVQLAAIEGVLNMLLPQRVGGRRRVAYIIEVRGTGGARGAFENGLFPNRPVPGAVFEPLATALGDLNPTVRVNAAYALAVLTTANTAAVPAAAQPLLAGGLTTMLASEDAALRLAAARAAGRAFRAPSAAAIGSVRPVSPPLSDALIGLMNQAQPEEQSAAIQALGLMREVRSVQAITDRFAYHRDRGPRPLALVALEALARIAEPSSEQIVRETAVHPWAGGDAETALFVSFARERLLHDGSVAEVRAAVSNAKLRERAEGFLLELGAR